MLIMSERGLGVRSCIAGLRIIMLSNMRLERDMCHYHHMRFCQTVLGSRTNTESIVQIKIQEYIDL